jgi:hypothetical protein
MATSRLSQKPQVDRRTPFAVVLSDYGLAESTRGRLGRWKDVFNLSMANKLNLSSLNRAFVVALTRQQCTPLQGCPANSGDLP